MWALATMGRRPEQDFLGKMQLRATALEGEFMPKNISNLTWALASMGVTPEVDLLEAMQRRATALAGEFKPQETANMLWAHACFGVPLGGFALYEAMAASLLSGFAALNVSEKAQIQRWLLSLSLEPAWKACALPASVQRLQVSLFLSLAHTHIFSFFFLPSLALARSLSFSMCISFI
jgi:hypothetical protein